MIIDKTTNLKNYNSLVKNLDRAVKFIEGNYDLAEGVYPFEGGRVVATELTSAPLVSKEFEAHRNFADVMIILEGEETVSYTAFEDMTPTTEYDAEKDVAFYTGEDLTVSVPAGYFYIVMPGEGHKPGIHLDEESTVKKYIVKLEQ